MTRRPHGPTQLTVTDDDVIEKSNLSRQFLFRNHNVGQSKSLSAVQAAASMNPEVKATALQDRVSPDTEHVFNSAFWTSLDVVINALDNVKARLYVDQQCVLYGKPLLESCVAGPLDPSAPRRCLCDAHAVHARPPVPPLL